MNWRRSLSPPQQERLRVLVGAGLVQRTPPAVLLDELMNEGLSHETAIMAFVHFRWTDYPRWVRAAALLGRHQSRTMLQYGIAGLLMSAIVLFVMGWLGWSKNPDGNFVWCWLGSVLLLGRTFWQWRARRWVDRHGSWLFAGLNELKICVLSAEVQQELQERRTTSDQATNRLSL